MENVREKYPTLTEVQATTHFRDYQPDDWAVILDEWTEDEKPLDNSLDEWYNLLGGGLDPKGLKAE